MSKEYISPEEGKINAKLKINGHGQFESWRIKEFRRELARRAGGNEYVSWFDQAIYDDKNPDQVMIAAPNSFVESMWERRFPWVMQYVTPLPDPYAELAQKNFNEMLDKYLGSTPLSDASRKLIREQVTL